MKRPNLFEIVSLKNLDNRTINLTIVTPRIKTKHLILLILEIFART